MLASVASLDFSPRLSPLAADVALSLNARGQKTLPCKYLYDEVGTLLFEAICALPEYGLTCADDRLLRAHAAEIAAAFPRGTEVAELGSGSGEKTRWVLEAFCRRASTTYTPIEISALALARCQQRLDGVSGLSVRPCQAEFLAGLSLLPRRSGQPLLVLFLGSSLGNFTPREARLFLGSLSRLLRPGDGLLLGLDLLKPAAQLRRAYDDPTGVTAAFNLNLLARLNRELGADFDLRQWEHRAVYRARPARIEMHLRSRRDQAVHVPGIGTIAFRKGETIWSESSHKYRASEIKSLLAEGGFQLEQQWRDSAWPFAESLAKVRS
ncbi:MAG TPA: L-histidine N(alpha)-methyltransferase [Terriglobales bacterium]|nr:L-histidine N(alpha)-methyltransferase [Terriglobales bacterium]